jgi:hypothetical protein
MEQKGWGYLEYTSGAKISGVIPGGFCPKYAPFRTGKAVSWALDMAIVQTMNMRLRGIKGCDISRLLGWLANNDIY